MQWDGPTLRPPVRNRAQSTQEKRALPGWPVRATRPSGLKPSSGARLGISGHTALDRAVLGSSTHDVVRKATCPVLTVRHRPSG